MYVCMCMSAVRMWQHYRDVCVCVQVYECVATLCAQVYVYEFCEDMWQHYRDVCAQVYVYEFCEDMWQHYRDVSAQVYVYEFCEDVATL